MLCACACTHACPVVVSRKGILPNIGRQHRECATRGVDGCLLSRNDCTFSLFVFAWFVPVASTVGPAGGSYSYVFVVPRPNTNDCTALLYTPGPSNNTYEARVYAAYLLLDAQLVQSVASTVDIARGQSEGFMSDGSIGRGSVVARPLGVYMVSFDVGSGRDSDSDSNVTSLAGTGSVLNVVRCTYVLQICRSEASVYLVGRRPSLT